MSQEEIERELQECPGWSIEEGKLTRNLSFKDFSEAFAFMTQAAFISEKMDHHPNWSNVYNGVFITLWTHDCGGISGRDIEWIKRVNNLLTHYVPLSR